MLWIILYRERFLRNTSCIPSLSAPKLLLQNYRSGLSGYKSSFNKLACFPYLYKDHLSSSHPLDLKVDFVLFLKRFYPCCLKTGDLGLNPRRERRTILAIQSTTYQPATSFQMTSLILDWKASCIHSLCLILQWHQIQANVNSSIRCQVYLLH